MALENLCEGSIKHGICCPVVEMCGSRGKGCWVPETQRYLRWFLEVFGDTYLCFEQPIIMSDKFTPGCVDAHYAKLILTT